VLESIHGFQGVPGRLQRVHCAEKQNPFVFIDYAHTPDALEKVLRTLQQLKSNQHLKVLFGCGGDRDPGKRPLMAAIAEQFADAIFVTSDNPRTEDPQKIISDILSGFQSRQKVQVLEDRQQAIQNIIHQSSPGDIILIAGKGHENYQIIGENKFPFSDYQESLKILSGSVLPANRKNQ
jgi:UDP-N-acetylmuramoyl-L-alanyl-D-glutamate--2,6-diaminopimelate ligase